MDCGGGGGGGDGGDDGLRWVRSEPSGATQALTASIVCVCREYC